MRGLIGFDYVRADSLEDAWDAFDYEPKARILAGGTDLLVQLKTDQIRTPIIISLKNIQDIRGISDRNDLIEIGTLTSVSDIANSELIRKKCPLLKMAADKLGSPQIRNLATIGGNLCNASPAGDLCLALTCLEAKLIIKSRENKRETGIKDFFKGPGSTSLNKKEILTSILVPVTKENWKWNYQKLGKRKGVECAVISLAVGLQLNGNICQAVRIALGAVAPTPVRASTAELEMINKPLSPELIEGAATTASQQCNPISDIRGSAEYRKEMIKNLTRRAFMTILNSQRGQQ